MQYARLGDTGLIVSRLSFGSMTFGTGQGIFASVAKVDQASANDLVARAIDGGINFFNSADVYAGGESERVLGKALGAKRPQVVIATKLGNRMGDALVDAGLSRRHVIAACEASLARLGTDYIDVYLPHKVDTLTPLEETLEALESLVRAGKVRYLGFSNWPAWLAAKAVGAQRARGYTPLRAAEMHYSLVVRDLEHEVLPFCADAGIGVLAWSPLAGGFLSGKYTRERPKGGSADRLGGFDLLPYDRERGHALLDLLRTLAARRGTTPAQISIAWVLRRSTVTTAIIGASRADQLADNLKAVDVVLADEEWAQLDEATKPVQPYPHWFNARVADSKAHNALGIPLAVKPLR